MSVTMCVFCDSMVDTDYHECCPSCERCPFGEYMFCGTCAFYTTPHELLHNSKCEGKCLFPGGPGGVDADTESCDHYEDAEYNNATN